MMRPLIAALGHATLLAMVALCFQTQTQAERDTWRAIKTQLEGNDGDKFFKEQLQDALLPSFSATVVSVLENRGVSKLVVALSDAVTPEVTLVIHNGIQPLKKDIKGSVVTFEGIARAFGKQPFMLTLDVPEGRSTGIIPDR